MSTVAKVFVVLNLLLAGLFLGSAAALLGHSDNWKVRHDDVSGKLDTTSKDLTAEKKRYETDVAALQGRVTEANSAKTTAVQERDTLKSQNDSLMRSHNDLAASLAASTRAIQVAQTTIQNGRGLVDELQKERQTLIDNLTAARTEKDAAVKMQNQIEQNLGDLTRQHQDSTAKLATAEESLKHARFELEEYARRFPGAGSGTAQPMQSARVLAADGDANIIVISIGSDDGVKAGYRYTVSRGTTYVAQIEITNVESKQSAGKVLKVTQKQPVRPGDDVATATTR